MTGMGHSACRPDEHDWRVDPHQTLLSFPPQQRLVCAICGANSSRVAPGTKIYGHDPKQWPKAKTPPKPPVGADPEHTPRGRNEP